jgi:hypothetical protein
MQHERVSEALRLPVLVIDQADATFDSEILDPAEYQRTPHGDRTEGGGR